LHWLNKLLNRKPDNPIEGYLARRFELQIAIAMKSSGAAGFPLPLE